MDHIEVIYRNGALYPTTAIDLEENTKVSISIEEIHADGGPHLSPQEQVAKFREWVNAPRRKVPTLSDEQISRESMYEEQIQRQL